MLAVLNGWCCGKDCKNATNLINSHPLVSRIDTMNYPKRPSLVDGTNEMSTKSVLKNFGVTEFSAQFDYVMVFKVKEGPSGPEQSAAARTCMNAMLNAGLEIFPYLSVQKDEIYVLIRAPVSISYI